jgi:hypothetical protein
MDIHFENCDDVPREVSTVSGVKLDMSMYLGERCKYCGKQYKTLEDLKDTVYAGYHERGRLACKSCWAAHHHA